MSNKILILALLIVSNIYSNAQSTHTAMPRTIKVEGENTISLDPDVIDVDFNIINETEVHKIKMPLDKVESQLKQHLISKGISPSKFISSTDPTLCNATYKTCYLKNLTLKEYQAIYPYYSKHLFANSFYVTKRTVYKESIQKISDALLKGSIENAKNKAYQIASTIKEKIKYVQSIQMYQANLDVTENYIETSGNFDSIQEKIKFSNNINVEYAIETPSTTNTGFEYPRLVYVSGLSKKTIQNEVSKFSFNLSLLDYEEGDPKAVFDKNKEDIYKTLLSHGVTPSDIIIRKSEYNSEEMNLSYIVHVRGFNHINNLYLLLSKNKNITNLTSEKISNENIYEKYESEMLTQSIEDADQKAKKIASLYGIELTRKFDVIDSKIVDNNYEVIEAVNDAMDALRGKTLPQFSNKISKNIYISYEIK